VIVLLVAGSAGAVTRPGGAPRSTRTAVVAPAVLERLATAKPSDVVKVIVRLRQQADLTTIDASTRRERLREVIEMLQDTARATQGPLIDLLSERQAEGLVQRFTPFWVFNGFAVAAAPQVVEELAARPQVAAITQDAAVPSPQPEPMSSSSPPEPNVDLVNAPALWGMGITGQGVVVANMDTGVDTTNSDLAGSWRGSSNSWFDPNGQHATPADVNGHGTWTMGVMVSGSGGGTATGIAPGARWIAVKIFDDAGVATASDIHAGYQWLLDPDGSPATPDAPTVVNNSWTMGSVGCDLQFQLDLRSLRAAGILPVFAAGNYGPGASTSASPANNPEAFAVGGTTNGDVLYSGSSRGPSACGEPQTIFPELTAPGVSIRTTDLFGLYTQQTGTSLAAPHAAGALALLLGAFPDLAADVQAEALESGAVDLGAVGPDNDAGFGRLDVLASYAWLATRADFALTISPSSLTTSPGGTVESTVTVTPVNGFAGDVALSLGGLSPTQATWSFAPATIAGGSGSSQLTIVTTESLSPDTYPVTVEGTSGTVVHSSPLTLVVDAASDFALSVSPSSRSVKRGGSAAYTVSVSSQGGFAGTVGLSVVGLPSGASVTFSPLSVAAPGSSTMTVKTNGRTARGTFTLTVIGQSGPSSHQTTATLIVK